MRFSLASNQCAVRVLRTRASVQGGRFPLENLLRLLCTRRAAQNKVELSRHLLSQERFLTNPAAEASFFGVPVVVVQGEPRIRWRDVFPASLARLKKEIGKS